MESQTSAFADESPSVHISSRRFSLWDGAVFLVAAAYTIVYAWPASVQPWRYVWGSHGDALGNAFEYTWAAAMLHAGRPLTINHQTAWPFGDALGSIPHDPLFWWFTIGLSYLIGAVPALNILSLVAIPVAAWVMYRLALYVTGNPAASLVAGIGFGCSTFFLENSRGEPTLAQAWVFPLEVLALIFLFRRRRPLTVVLAGLAVALAATVDFYYALFAALIAVVFSGTWVALNVVEKRQIEFRPLVAIACSGFIALAIAGSVYVGTFGNLQAQAQQIRRPASQLSVLAATPLDFVLPPRSNPWFGGPRSDLVAAKLRRTGALVDLAEVAIPLPVLFLGTAGLVLVAWSLVRRRLHAGWRLPEVGALIAVSAVGLWLMVPPDAVPKHSLSLQWDIYRLAPQFQAYHRAVLLVELGAGVLTAIALAQILPARVVYSLPIVALLCVAILVEDFMWPADRALDVTTPPEYSWLTAHAGQYAIAEYPLFTNDAQGNEWTYDFNTRFHPFAIVNGHISNNESASMRVELEDPNRPGVAANLATLGVRYIVWHEDLAGVPTTFGAVATHTGAGYRPQPPSYVEEASFPDQTAVYSVEAEPTAAFPFFAAGFGAIASPKGRPEGRWLQSSTGQLDVYGSMSRQSVAVTFQCWGSAASPTLALSAGGMALGTWQLSASQPVDVRFNLVTVPGVNRVRVNATPSSAAATQDLTFCTLPAANAA